MTLRSNRRQVREVTSRAQADAEPPQQSGGLLGSLLFGFDPALLADFRVQDREAFECRPEKAQRQKDFRWREHRHIDPIEPGGDDTDKLVIGRQRCASGLSSPALAASAQGRTKDSRCGGGSTSEDRFPAGSCPCRSRPKRSRVARESIV